MRGKLFELLASDASRFPGGYLSRGAPPDLENFLIGVQAFIGAEEDASGGETVQFKVCTPRWIADHLGESGALWGRALLIVDHYDVQVIWDAVATLCASQEEATWHEIGAQLSKYGEWEFDFYQP